MIYLVGVLFIVILLMWSWDIYCFWSLDGEMEERVREICEEWRREQEGRSS